MARAFISNSFYHVLFAGLLQRSRRVINCLHSRNQDGAERVCVPCTSAATLSESIVGVGMLPRQGPRDLDISDGRQGQNESLEDARLEEVGD